MPICNGAKFVLHNHFMIVEMLAQDSNAISMTMRQTSAHL